MPKGTHNSSMILIRTSPGCRSSPLHLCWWREIYSIFLSRNPESKNLQSCALESLTGQAVLHCNKVFSISPPSLGPRWGGVGWVGPFKNSDFLLSLCWTRLLKFGFFNQNPRNIFLFPVEFYFITLLSQGTNCLGLIWSSFLLAASKFV